MKKLSFRSRVLGPILLAATMMQSLSPLGCALAAADAAEGGSEPTESSQTTQVSAEELAAAPVTSATHPSTAPSGDTEEAVASSLSSPVPVTPAEVGTDLAMELAMALIKGAAGKAGGEAAGWVMKSLGMPDEGQDLGELKTELEKQTQLLQGIQTQLTGLSTQVDQAKTEILDATDKANYETGARILQAPVANIQGTFQRLIWLTQADPTTDHSQEIRLLQEKVQSDVLPALFQIHNTLVDTAGVTGLVPLWSSMVAKRVPGYPTFLTNEYLRPTNAQLDYYRGIQTIAVALVVETYHAQTPTDSSMAVHYLNLLDTNLAQQRSYVPSPLLPDDNLFIDTRSNLMWQRKIPMPSMAGGEPNPYTTYELAIPYVQAMRDGGYADWQLPTVAQLQTLNVGASGKLYLYLNANGFRMNSFQVLLSSDRNCLFGTYDGTTACGSWMTGAGVPFAVRAWKPAR